VNRSGQPTSYPDVNGVLDSLGSHIQRILAGNLVGLYLYGSLTTGDFDPEQSDIDLLAATALDLTSSEFEELRAMHHDFACANSRWNDRVEVAYLSMAALKTFRSYRRDIAVISPGEPFHLKDAGNEYLVNWYMAREKGIALFGPAPSAIIDPISRNEFVRTIREHALAWGEWLNDARERKSQAYAIITLCRALYTHKNGDQISKKKAVLWAQEELREWSDLIRNAEVWREAREEEPVDHAATYSETVRFVNFVRNQIASTPGFR
jgi:hypothetical protein